MASFTKRGKTWTYIVSRYTDGKYDPIRKGGFRTKKEAQVAAAEVEANLSKGIVPHLKPEPFNEYFKSWLELYKTNIGKNTRERYINTLNTIDDEFGGKPIQDIKRKEYQQFLNEYGKTRSKETVRKLNTHIRACVKDAIDEGIISKDFTRKAVITGLAPKKASEKHINYDESKLLLNLAIKKINEIDDTKKKLPIYIILLGLTSGMRFGEMVGLTRKDFNFSNNTINIDKTWGYTKKMHEGFGPTKNEQSERVIKMDPKTMAIFKKMFNSTPENIHRLVFYNQTSKYKVVSNATVNATLKSLLSELKVEPISVHGLRHTHASVLIYQRKVTINYISERLGHKDIETTIKDYSHVLKELREEDQLDAANIMNAMYA